MNTTATQVADWIRPWYVGRDGDHIREDCPLLQQETDTPTEGSGWLNPNTSNRLCPECFVWDARCRCWSTYSSENAGTGDLKRVQKWMGEHFCLPQIDLTAHARPPAATAVPANQTALFPLSDLTAVEATR